MNPASPTTRVVLALGAVALVVAACGDDDGADVRDLGAESSESGSGSGSGSGSASGSASASAPASGSASGSGSASAPAGSLDCVPVNPELESEATQTITVVNTDFAFDQDEYTAEAGVITFEVENAGGEPHELAFLPGGGDVPFTEDGEVDEDALAAAGAFELEAFDAGQTCNATYDLAPGTYTLFCIVEASDGETHWEKGMGATLVVS